jgi:hypothetical protein
MPFNIKKLWLCGFESIHKSIKKREPGSKVRLSKWSLSTQWTILPTLLFNQLFRFEIQNILPRNSVAILHGTGVKHHRGGTPISIGGNEMSQIKYWRSGECLRPKWVWYSITQGDYT